MYGCYTYVNLCVLDHLDIYIDVIITKDHITFKKKIKCKGEHKPASNMHKSIIQYPFLSMFVTLVTGRRRILCREQHYVIACCKTHQSFSTSYTSQQPLQDNTYKLMVKFVAGVKECWVQIKRKSGLFQFFWSVS